MFGGGGGGAAPLVTLHARGHSRPAYDVDLRRMQQTNKATNFERGVRRVTAAGGGHGGGGGGRGGGGSGAATWEWRDDRGWKPFDENCAAQLEGALAAGFGMTTLYITPAGSIMPVGQAPLVPTKSNPPLLFRIVGLFQIVGDRRRRVFGRFGGTRRASLSRAPHAPCSPCARSSPHDFIARSALLF